MGNDVLADLTHWRGSMLGAVDLEFSYETGAPIVSAWSHNFASGALTALTGRSGRGKSTLLYLLGQMLRPTSGSIYVAGVPSQQLTDAERSWLRATYFGFVFQDAALDPTRTVLDNVTEVRLYRGGDRRADRARALELLERFGVTVPPSRKPGQVSGGQAQRIALCRALFHEPPILLADEPTGNLDYETSALVMSAFEDHAQRGGTVIIVTHDPKIAARCDHELSL